MVFLRSTLFFVLSIVNTVFFGLFTLPASLIHARAGYECARTWGRVELWMATYVCGMRYRIAGLENIPNHPCISMAKHQSAWETIFILCHIPRAVWIIKKELVWLPVVGWVLAALKSIAIDRKSGKAAIEQIIEQGQDRLAKGWWISIFPEGTRVPPGKRGRYGMGGAVLATCTGADILPIAHNAGECWGRYAFRKKPGCISVSIGPLIHAAGRTPAEVIKDVEDWIEGEMARFPPAAP